MNTKKLIEKFKNDGRCLEVAEAGDPDLGPLQNLPGTWRNEPNLSGRGWNMIALPFARPPFNYRLLLNQYNEELTFSFVDKAVPNRGIDASGSITEKDQLVVTLDYQQKIRQIAAEDRIAMPNGELPESGDAGAVNMDIHHEPGLWLHMLNFRTNELDMARLASIPHGDSVLALGKSTPDGDSTIPTINPLPIGVSQDVGNNPYLSPYKHFQTNKFKGLFDPTDPSALLRAATPQNIVKTTILEVDSTLESGGVVNIPFIVDQANAASMKSTFWIHELEPGADGKSKFQMQYLQVVMLDFFPRRDGNPGLIAWPHVSFNTMEKVSDICETTYHS